MAEFLLELYSEEIPAGMQRPAAEHFVKELGLEEFYFTPQRIVVTGDLPTEKEEIVEERRGPKIDAPEQAVQGFLRSCGYSSVDEAEIREVKGAQHYFRPESKSSVPMAEYLAKKVPEVLANYTWPKSMRWGDYEMRWVRPLHSILCIFDGKVIDFEFGHIKSGNVTKGHRFLAADEFEVANFEQYQKELHDRKVVVNQEHRHEVIKEELDKISPEIFYNANKNLIHEIVNLVEWPQVAVGEFSEEFLEVPWECLVSSMEKHQKYISIFDAKESKLTNKFVFVSNMVAEDGGEKIIAGNERVLKARLSDAKFFWDQDRKQSLEDFLPKLEKVTFHNKVGNMLEKAKRIEALAGDLAGKIGADVEKAKRAGLLCKADLVSEMVGEFADLQGLMGGYYAQDQEIGEAIKLHYGEPKDNKLAISVALADKLDSLTTLWAAGEKPTGSGDPFALRRAALQIIRIVISNDLRLNIKEFVNVEVFDFVIDRVKHMLRGEEIRSDIVDAVLGQGDDLLVIYNKAQALKEFLATENGADLLAAYKRAANILTAEEKKDSKSYEPSVDAGLLQAAEEKALFEAIEAAENGIQQSLAAEKFGAAMADLAALRPQVNAFFDNVIVNADDAATRENRLKVLAKIRQFIDLIADFGKIEK